MDADDGLVTQVSEHQAPVPEPIRRELGIEDGDRLRWTIKGSAVLVEVDDGASRTFAEFDGYDGGGERDGTSEHDGWGVE